MLIEDKTVIIMNEPSKLIPTPILFFRRLGRNVGDDYHASTPFAPEHAIPSPL